MCVLHIVFIYACIYVFMIIFLYSRALNMLICNVYIIIGRKLDMRKYLLTIFYDGKIKIKM
jgi:hypothetical protein